jgi:hypothetical protein
LRSRTLKNVTDILDYRTGLLPDVEARCAEWIDFSSGNGIVGASRTGSGHKQEVTAPLYVGILAARCGFSFDHFTFVRAHVRSVIGLQLDANIVRFGIEI